VGGCVRDFLLGRDPQDFDIATDAKPEQVEKLFKKTIPVGRKFGVVIVVENHHQFQVATFRAEADYKDGRRPEKVHFAHAEADAVRRDFTVNGLFYDPHLERIHDWVGGEQDLRAKIIRTIGRPEERFGEDHLRMLRAVRFAARLGFEVEPGTFAAIQRLAPKINAISAERVREELVKLFAPPPSETLAVTPALSPVERGGLGADKLKLCPPAARGLDLLRDSGLLEHILPELVATEHCEQPPDFHPEGSVFNHIRLMLEKMLPGADELLPWAVLLHDIAKPVTAQRDAVTGRIHFYGHEKIGAAMAEVILRRLKFSKAEIEAVCAAVRHHMQFNDVPRMRKATLRRMLLRGTFPLELALHRLDSLGSDGGLDYYDFCVAAAEEMKRVPEIHPPLLTGDDLIAMGIPRGKRIGKLLHELRDKQLAEELKTADEARAWVKQRLV
jgi:poly(A) polymerase